MDVQMRSLTEGYQAVVIGASGGIGAAFVEHLRSDPRCANVMTFSRHSEPAIELTDEESIRRSADWVAARSPEIDIVIDSTGVLTIDGQGPEKTIARLDPTIMARSLAINAIGPALLFKHFAPLLPRRRRAILATLSARVGSIEDNRRGGWISYRTAKAALNQIVKTAAIEIAMRHPQAVCVGLQPGTVRTPLSEPYARGEGIIEPAEATARLLAVLDRLEPSASGGLYDHAGERIPG